MTRPGKSLLARNNVVKFKDKRRKYVSKFNNPRQVQFFRLSDCETVKTPGCQPQQIGDESLARAGCKYYDSTQTVSQGHSHRVTLQHYSQSIVIIYPDNSPRLWENYLRSEFTDDPQLVSCLLYSVCIN